MNLEVSEARSFLALASELHFGRAARQLFVSQPALSKQLKRLEDKLGGALFTRSKRKVSLTDSGRALQPLAERLLESSAAAFSRARDVAAGRAGSLRVGFGIASVAEVLPRTLLRFRKAYPDVTLELHDQSTPSQVAGLLQGRLDLGVLRLPLAHGELSSVRLFRERVVLVAPALSTRPLELRLAALRDEPFIFLARENSATFHDHSRSLCRKVGFEPHIVQEASEMFTILNLVRAGIGVALVPSAALGMNVPGVRFAELGLREAEWRIGAAWNPSSEKQALIAAFLSTLQGVAGKAKQRD
jgi:DNA-binding transcriptional LysR family regulator